MRKLAFALVSFALVVLMSGFAVAQDATGTVLGTVSDPQGSVIPGVQVTVTNVATQQQNTTKTGPDGSFRVYNLPIGDYTVSVEQSGFTKLVTAPQKLQINQSLRFDLKLQLGKAEQTVEVASNAVAVETVNSTLGQSVTSRPLVDLPLNGRNVLDLALLQPGVTPTNPDSSAAGGFSVAGGRTDSVTYLLDGGVNNNLLDNSAVMNPNPDAVAEFRILQNNYTAEYGRNGGGIVSMAMKSGGNKFHGSAFEFLRNDALNANSYFNNMNGLPRDVLKRNQFGGTIGGPILKDKLFFFVAYQGQRLSRTDPSPQNPVQTFTPAELNGDFSNASPDDKSYVVSFLQANPYFQPNAALAAQGIIDPTRIDPVAKNYIAAGLVPTTSSPDGLLYQYGHGADNRNELDTKFDYNMTSNDKLSVTLSTSRITQDNAFDFANVNGYPNQNKTHNYFANIAYTRTFTNSLLNEFRFTAQRNNALRHQTAASLPNAQALGVGITQDDPVGPPNLLFDTGLALGFSEQGPTDLVNNTFSYADNLSWVKGAHTFKFGGGFTPYQNNTIYDYIVNGEFDFASLEDFLFGNPYYLYQYPKAPSNIRSKNTFIFGQDEWHVSRRLVLTLGLRYEYSTPKSDTLGRSQSFIPGLQSTRFVNAPPGLVFPGDPGAPTGANFPDKNDWAPRFGFAWDPFGDGKTSIRGGFGVFYDILKGEDNLQFNGQPPFFAAVGFGFNQPFGLTSTGTGYLTDPFGSTGNVNPFPSTPPPANLDFATAGFLPINGGESLYLVDPHLRTPYIYQFNLGVQHEIARNTVAEIAYAGSLGRKMTALVDQNPMDPNSIYPIYVAGDPSQGVDHYSGNRVYNEQANVASCNAASPSGYCYAYLPVFKNVVNQEYNALQASITRQLSDTGALGRTYFTLGYTWSHNIDNASGFRERNSQVPAWNTNLFRASSDIDLRHRVTFSGGWDMALDRWWQSGPKRLTQGWSWYPIFSWQTGFPFDIPAHFPSRFDPDQAGPSGYGDAYLAYANVVGPTTTGLTHQPGAVYWMDPNSFSRACEYVDPVNGCPNGYGTPYGTLGRNALRAPGRTNLDLTLAKSTKITEGTSLQLRVDAFNVFNHAEFQAPDTDIRHSTFGQILNTYDPRIIQIGAKFVF